MRSLILFSLVVFLSTSCVSPESRLVEAGRTPAESLGELGDFLDVSLAEERFASLQKLYSLAPDVGPNCWNVTLFIHGYTSVARYVDYSEILNLYSSPSCKKVGTYPQMQPQPGLISSYSRERIKHADFVVNNGWSLHKPGPGMEEKYAREKTEQIIQFNSQTGYCEDQNCYFTPKLDYYRCQKAEFSDKDFMQIKGLRDLLHKSADSAPDIFKTLQKMDFKHAKYILLEKIIFSYDIERKLFSNKKEVQEYRKKALEQLIERGVLSADLEILSSVIKIDDLLRLMEHLEISKMSLTAQYLITESIASQVYAVIYENSETGLVPKIIKNSKAEKALNDILKKSQNADKKAILLNAASTLFIKLFGQASQSTPKEILLQCPICQTMIKETAKLNPSEQNAKFLYTTMADTLASYKIELFPHTEVIKSRAQKIR